MRGSLHAPVLGFGPGGAGVIAWTQFRTASTVHPKSWLATTSDGGRSWTVEHRTFSLFANPVFGGPRDGWAQGVDPNQTLRFYVSHDGGRSWTPAQSAAAADSVDGNVSVAGGVTWAVGIGSCANGRCRWIVMRGPASGDRLPATAVQPLPPTNQNATTISASSATTAYVASPADHGTVIYATHDGGRHWQRIPDQCSGGSTEFGLSAPSTDSLWRVCVLAKQFLVVRSTDGGSRWSATRLPFIPLYAFQPVSSQVAWSQDVHGTIYRTADGGASWQPVWRSDGTHGRPIPGLSPILSAQSGHDASLLIQLTRGPTSRDGVPRSTNLLVYRTRNGGRSWTPSVVELPHG
jgi:BNR/Asp-box repeat